MTEVTESHQESPSPLSCYRYLKPNAGSLLQKVIGRGFVFLDEFNYLISYRNLRHRTALSSTVQEISGYFSRNGVGIVSGKGERQLRETVKNDLITNDGYKMHWFMQNVEIPEEVDFPEERRSVEKVFSNLDSDKSNYSQGVDLLALYEAERKKFKRLSDEEMRVLAKQVAEQKDVVARNEIMKHNLGLVVWAAGRYRARTSEADFIDLVQEGNLGLMIAANRYDYRKPFKFSTYAYWWIRQGITRALQRASIVYRPTYIEEIRSKAWTASQKLFKKEGREPTLEEIAFAMKMPVKKLEEVYRATQEIWTLDEPAPSGDVDNEELNPLSECIASHAYVRQDVLIQAKETLEITCRWVRKVVRNVASLEGASSRNFEIFWQRYGLGNNLEGQTLEEVGNVFGVTRERIRQINEKTWEKLRDISSRYDEKSFLEAIVKIKRLEGIAAEEPVNFKVPAEHTLPADVDVAHTRRRHRESGGSKELPICDFEEQIIAVMQKNQVAIIVGETGSGKTTQLPQILYRAGFATGGMIGVTEPRRIAAISTAEFVADELGVAIGDKVGYQIRFDDHSRAGTKIKFMTDGILLRELHRDPDLRKYAVIVVDEAHERTENIDFALGLLKELTLRRKDLRLIVASATIDERKFSQYFGNAPIVNVSGRTFPVELNWSGLDIPQEKMNNAVVQKIAEIHENEGCGDILAFMAGKDGIRAVIDGLEKLELNNLLTIPLYAELPNEEQKKAFFPRGDKRKVIVATNIAETSITMDGVVYVVDSGLVKQSNFHPESGIQSLDVIEHSQSGCEQRRGRAGRTKSGSCYRMYTRENFQSRPRFTEPEIRRTSLASIVLAMEDAEIKNVREFDFIDPPDKEAFTEAYESLDALGAINWEEGGLTDIGKAMARLPIEPRIAHMVLEAEKHGCVKNVVTIAAFLSMRNIFIRPQGVEREADAAHSKFKNPESDVLTFQRIWREYENSGCSRSWCIDHFISAKTLEEVSNIRKQFLRVLIDQGVAVAENMDDEAVAKTIAMMLAYNLFERKSRHLFGGVLRSLENVSIHPDSTVFDNRKAQWVVAVEVMRTTKVWAHCCTVVKPEWLPEIVPVLARFGDPRIDSKHSDGELATITTPILYNDQHVGDIKRKINVAEAEQIRRKQSDNHGVALGKLAESWGARLKQ